MKTKKKLKLFLSKETISLIGQQQIVGGASGMPNSCNPETNYQSCRGTCTATDATLVGYCS